MALERLDKLLASTGRWSRKEVKDLVRQGRVLVNGRPVLRSEEKWEPTETELTVDGQRVDCAPFVYLMLHKPAGLPGHSAGGEVPPGEADDGCPGEAGDLSQAALHGPAAAGRGTRSR